MSECTLTRYGIRRAEELLEKRSGAVAWICSACDSLHVTDPDEARGDVTMRSVPGGILRYHGGGTIETVTRSNRDRRQTR